MAARLAQRTEHLHHIQHELSPAFPRGTLWATEPTAEREILEMIAAARTVASECAEIARRLSAHRNALTALASRRREAMEAAHKPVLVPRTAGRITAEDPDCDACAA